VSIEFTGEYWIATARSGGRVYMAEGDTRAEAFEACVDMLADYFA